MAKIKNEKFETGEKYKSDVNNDVFEVIGIHQEKGDFYVAFRHEKTQKISMCNISNAQRLLLTKIN